VKEHLPYLVQAGIPASLIPQREMVFDFNTIPRLQKTPYRIAWGGYRYGHTALLKAYKVASHHITFSFQSEDGVKEIIRNGKRIQHQRENRPYLTFLEAGTEITTIKALRHDELFFLYPAESGEALKNLNIPAGYFELTPSVLKIVQEIFTCFSALYHSGVADRLDFLVVRLLLEIASSQQEEKNDMPGQIYSAISHIARHFKEPFDPEALAKTLGMSLRSFYRNWKKIRPDTPHTFLRNTRLEYACNLLTSTHLEIQEIAFECGFQQTLHFSQSFLKKYGMTPTEYRKAFFINFK
jgi:hypothetical protein